MQSVYRGSVKYFLDFFQIRGLLVLLTGFLSASLPVAVFFLFPLAEATPARTNREDNKKLVIT